jgi:isoquinoline 1-oxidoreductase
MPADDSELQQHQVSPIAHGFELVRRDFFKVLGGGLLVCIGSTHVAPQESGARGGARREMPTSLDSWLHIGEDGQITALTGKVEMGQNVRTSLAQQVAEELRVPLSSIHMVMGDTDLTPFDLGTFGSRTTPQMGTQLRKVAASARAVLIEMAAERWQIPASGLNAENGGVRDSKSGRTVSYAELTRGQKLAKVIPDDPALTPASEWKIAGQSVPKREGREFVTGAHRYTADQIRPGMLYGKVVRPSGFHGRLQALDTSAAEKISGVSVVRDGDFVGVAAASEHTAGVAAAAIRARWEVPPQPSEKELFQYLKTHPAGQSGYERPDQTVTGSVEQARSQAAKTLEQTYAVAYVAHVPLEPRAALAEWNQGKLTVWTGTQRPFAVRDELLNAFHLAQGSVRVIVPDTGSAYGGKHTGEVAVEAARLAKAAGKAVRLVWTREEEFTWAYFRPAGVIEVRSGATADGSVILWEFDNFNSGPAGIDTPYDVPNQRIAFHPADSPLRQGSYRSLAAAANHFARESHMDELAHEIGMDPLEFRLKNLKNERLRAVFQAAAEKFGWSSHRNSNPVVSQAGRSGAPAKATPVRGAGIAGGIEKNGYVATCAEVAIEGGEVKVARVVEAFDCGAVVNPQGLKNQISGAIVQGLGGALFEAIHFENGRLLNPHLGEYRVPRFSDLPQIEVVLVEDKHQPSMGAGETPLIGICPAVANAIFNATGTRLRSMPLAPNGLSVHPA